jgi:hypothetical protein
MPAVLTMDATITCHQPGKVSPTSKQTVLTVGGVEVLVDTLVGASITGCAQINANASEVPCATVASQTGQMSTVLKVDGKPVLLHQSSGLSAEGAPDKKWSETDAGQTVLTAA